MLRIGNKVRLSNEAIKKSGNFFIDRFNSEKRFVIEIVNLKRFGTNCIYYRINGFDGCFIQEQLCKDTFCKYME